MPYHHCCCCPPPLFPLPVTPSGRPLHPHHIEYGGRQWVDLSHASLSAEGFSVVPPQPCYHLKSLPIPAQKKEGPGTHAIFPQDFQAPGPVQGIVCLVQVQEDRMEDRLPHGCNLLKQFDLEGGSPHTAPHPGPSEGFVVGYGGGEAETENHCHRLPHQLHETYAAVVTTTFLN